MKVIYKTELVPGIEEIIDLYKNSDYFPIKDESDLARIQKMHDQADIVASAWYKDKLIGLSRALSDFSYCCYLSDLCVRNEYKRRGIGQKLIELTKVKAGKECKLILQSSPNAIAFYTKIGMKQIDSAFIIQREY
jgi:ribosomal protein S18 acetylase RimI-like enzyme